MEERYGKRWKGLMAGPQAQMRVAPASPMLKGFGKLEMLGGVSTPKLQRGGTVGAQAPGMNPGGVMRMGQQKMARKRQW
jgi:hypothetical protein